MRQLTVPMLTLASIIVMIAGPIHAEGFGDYWYRGAAEITSYDLEQARYGEIHRGHAVLIFVTEDFSDRKHVKLDNPRAAGDDAVPILKLNATKSFHTGVYPYSMMMSVFSPLEATVAPMKITTSSQEWCGHTFTQLNKTDAGYRLEERSYFESEGDHEARLDGALPEDGLWNAIRVDPAALPTGRLQLIPATFYQRLSHRPWQPARAEASLTADPDDDAISIYRLDYGDADRTLTIRFRSDFPHEIESWEETYVSGWGPSANRLTTRAVRKKRIMLDYWNRHDVADAALRAQLDLD